MELKRSLVLGVATCGGIGYIPWAPGTFGSVAGGALYLLVSLLPRASAGIAVAAFAAASIWFAHQAEGLLGGIDPGQIVIDEAAGMMVALFLLPVKAPVWIAGFFLFRILDIIKPFPIGWAERFFSGGAGIVLDDVMAGAAVNLLLRALLYAGWLPFM
jgi:phosphatidylglycerophosphatase A